MDCAQNRRCHILSWSLFAIPLGEEFSWFCKTSHKLKNPSRDLKQFIHEKFNSVICFQIGIYTSFAINCNACHFLIQLIRFD